MDIQDMWAKSTTRRIKKGGDLYRAPLTAEQMSAPLAWHEKQMAVAYRYGVLSDGSVGHKKVHVAEEFLQMHPDFNPV